MKKIFNILLVVIMAAALFAGCQATPEKPVVIQKDMEQMIEKAVTEDDTRKGDSLVEYLNAPKTYTASFDGYNGDLTVNADATVTIPDSAGISVMRVSKHYFTQEEADKMIEVLLQGATLYEEEQTLTKEEIQSKLVTFYGMRDGAIPINVDGENPNDPERLEQLIKYYENLLPSAPETNDLTPADTSFHAVSSSPNPDAKIIRGMATVNGKAAFLYINNGASGVNNIEVTFLNAEAQLSGGNSPYKILSKEEMSGVEVPRTFTMTTEAAQNTADGVLTRLGITGIACVETRYAVMIDGIAGGNADAGRGDFSPEQLKNGKWAYCLQYQRMINGVPITLTSHDGASREEENEVAEPWPYEKLEIIVDETGIVYFYYRSPYNVQETVTEDAALKQFPEIVSVFGKMFPITYGYLDEEGTDYRLQADIAEIRLGLMRVTEQNSRDTALLIPVWDFIGSVTVIPDKGEPYQFSNTSDSLITINAIDGAIIDRSLGY